jgi:oligopeptidase B
MLRRLAVLALALAAGCSSASREAPHGAPTAAKPVVSDAAVAEAPKPPIAARRPHDVVSLHGTRNDPYYWLRDDTRKNAEVLAYLAAENAYAAAMLAPAQDIEDAIVEETRARMQEVDASPAIFDAGYWYYARFEQGAQHPIHARRKGSMTSPEEILLDGNQLASGQAFFAFGDYAVSPNGRMLAWTDDTVGRLQFTLHVKDLSTGAVLADTAAAIGPSVAWANDNATLFYVGKDAATLREDRVMRHRLGGPHDLVYREADSAFYVDVRALKSRRYIAIEIDETLHSETRLIDADKPLAPIRVFLARKPEHVYQIDHVGDRFVMRTNEGAENFRIVEVPARDPEKRRGWRELLPHRANVLVEDMAVYEALVAAEVRVDGLSRLQIIPNKGDARMVDGLDPTYAMQLVDTPDPKATLVRYTYDSPTTPRTTFEVDIASSKRVFLHREPTPTYDPARYASEYRHATAPDGTRVPISIAYRKDTKLDGTAPVLVLGYGAYGISKEPTFARAQISLLDRGFVVAIAHVRGGAELGDAWYDAGRKLAKRNTFTDFIAATEFLVTNRYGAKDRVFAEGASAGGLLIGAIANMRPDLYRGLVAWVPFVDAVTTMLDESIPLVTNEYEEWGNPTADKATYDYMLGYSPYDNVRATAYPAMYVRTALFDSEVQYYEPAKWVAKLRATKTDGNVVVLETDATAGHGGKSGRFEAVREQARAYAFMLLVLGDAAAARR